MSSPPAPPHSESDLQKKLVHGIFDLIVRPFQFQIDGGGGGSADNNSGYADASNEGSMTPLTPLLPFILPPPPCFYEPVFHENGHNFNQWTLEPQKSHRQWCTTCKKCQLAFSSTKHHHQNYHFYQDFFTTWIDFATIRVFGSLDLDANEWNCPENIISLMKTWIDLASIGPPASLSSSSSSSSPSQQWRYRTLRNIFNPSTSSTSTAAATTTALTTPSKFIAHVTLFFDTVRDHQHMQQTSIDAKKPLVIIMVLRLALYLCWTQKEFDRTVKAIWTIIDAYVQDPTTFREMMIAFYEKEVKFILKRIAHKERYTCARKLQLMYPKTNSFVFPPV